MKTQHTAGPWEPNLYRVFSRSKRIAEVETAKCTHEEAISNARVIAAAPDLLEALKNAREDLSELAQLVQSGSFDAAEDWIEANAAQINVTLSRVIANAEGSDQ